MSTTGNRNSIQTAGWLAAAGLAGILAGSMLVTFLRMPSPALSDAAGPSTIEEPAPIQVTSPTLSQIQRELEAIRQLLSAMQQEGVDTGHTGEATNGSRTPESDGSKQAFLAASEELRAASRRLSGSQGLVFPTGALPQSFPKAEGDRFNELMKGNMLLSFQQVLDKYGMPDKVWPGADGSMTWQYHPDEGRTISLFFNNGLLCNWDD